MIRYAIIASVVALLCLIVWRSRRAAAVRRVEEESPYESGLNALISGDRAAALRHLAQAVRDDPRNIDAYIRLGNLLRERGQIRQAIQVHRELLVKRRLPEGTRLEIVKNLALDLAEARRWPEVIEHIRSLPRPERSDLRMLRLARDAYEATGDLDQAVQAHKEILKATSSTDEPAVGVYQAQAALAALERGNRDRARAGFLAAVKESPEAVLANLHLGDMAAEEEDLERATAFWMKIVTDRPECAHLVFERLEKAYFELGDFGRMVGIYEDVVSRSPGSVHALAGLSRMLERKGDVDEAVGVAREAIKHEGDSLAGHLRLLELLVGNGRFEEAARLAETLVRGLAESAAPRKCRSCGEDLPTGGWRCPKCRVWVDAC
jgi:lipopolysaccharide biosynthesis regulator YciM